MRYWCGPNPQWPTLVITSCPTSFHTHVSFHIKRQKRIARRISKGILLFMQVTFCQINIFCHQLTQNMTTDFVRFFDDLHKLFRNSKFAKLLFFNFGTVFVNLTKSVVIFWGNWWQNMLIWQKTSCGCGSYCQNVFI